ncbi:hypothetical protein Tco_1555022 [Tanacetum coccineum]
MPPRKAPRTRTTPATTTNTTSVTNAQLQAMIDQGVAAALATRDANRSTNGEDSHNSGTGVRRTERVARECTYQDFMKCQPLFFKGTEGVVKLTQWTVGYDFAYEMTWTNLNKKMTDKYCPRSEIKKLEVELWNLKVKGTDNKRKLDNNNQAQQQSPKEKNVAQALRQLTCGERKDMRNSPLCNRSDCSELKNQNHGNQVEGTGASGLVHALGGGEADQDLNDMEDDICT